jgi:hypothetical protein
MMKYRKNFIPYFFAYFWPATALRAGGGGQEICLEIMNKILIELLNFSEQI